MKILHLNAGNETGGGMHHIIRVLGRLNDWHPERCFLGVMERKELYERALDQKIEAVHLGAIWRIVPLTVYRIAAYIRAHQITHVHTHGPRANVYMKWVKRLVSVHWITTIHSDPLEDFAEQGLYGRLLQRLHLQSLKHANAIIVVSQTFRSLLEQVGCRKNQIKVIHNGIDFLGELSNQGKMTRDTLGFRRDDFLIVQVARLHPVKAHHVALEAMRRIAPYHPSAHLLLIGDGPSRRYLQQLACDWQIADRIHFLGETEAVDAYYQLADVTLLTSVSESFPYVLLESARVQTPVITTAVGDVGMLFEGMEKGWQVAVNDVDAIVRMVTNAIHLKEKEELPIIGEKLYKQASKHFSLDKCAQEVYNVYKEL